MTSSSSLELVKAIRGIKNVLKSQDYTTDISDVQKSMDCVAGWVEDVSKQLTTLNEFMEEKHMRSVLSGREKELMERIENAIAIRNSLEDDVADIVHSIQNDGFASIGYLEGAMRDVLARKYPTCSNSKLYSAVSCGECKLMLFANQRLLGKHLEKERRNKEEAASKKRKTSRWDEGRDFSAIYVDETN
jgi:hypothetical protein